MSILLILWVITMFLWLLTALPIAPLQQFAPASWLLAFVAVLLLGLQIFRFW